jgi:hypothetical protein
VYQVAQGNYKTIEFLIAYISITGKLAGKDLSTPAKIKSYIESRQWPW